MKQNNITQLGGIDRAAYAPAEFAALFGRTAQWTWRHIREGAIRAVNIGGRTMIPATERDRLVEGRPIEAQATATA